MLRASVALPCLTVLAAACGGSPASEPAEPAAASIDSADIEAWSAGGASPEPSRQRSAEPAAAEPIELAGGERFRMLLALSRVRPASADDPHCSLYALRLGGPGLEEGRRTVGCEVALDPAPEVGFAPVQPARAEHLRAVLTGARAATGRVSERAKRYGEDVEYRITVRIVTDERSVEARVPPVEWPPPGAAEPEPALGRKPASLSELWEAVMFPHRFVARSAPSARLGPSLR